MKIFYTLIIICFVFVILFSCKVGSFNLFGPDSRGGIAKFDYTVKYEITGTVLSASFEYLSSQGQIKMVNNIGLPASAKFQIQ